MKITKNKIILKFLVILFGLWMFPFPLQYIPILSKLAEWWSELFQYIVLFVGNSFLSLENELTITRSGSGDKMYDYVQLFTILLIAFIGTFIWTLIDKNKGEDRRLNYWFWVYLRYNLFAIMLSYGLAKTFPLQFPEPSFSRLITEFGDMSPMGLAWSFMGYSKGYVIFSGFMEVIGALLLLHKRTVFLGAMILIAVTINILALNFLYDIPVKLYSVRYLMLAFLIASPQLRKVISLFITNNKIEPFQFYSPFKKAKWTRVKNISKWSLLFVFVISQAYPNYQHLYSAYGPLGDKPDLYGLYDIEKFKINGEERPPLLTDSLRWRYIISEFEGRVSIYSMDKKRQFYRSKVDTINNQITLSRYNDTISKYVFNYIKTDSTLVLDGVLEKDTIYLKSKRYTKKDFPLMNREFNWIQEYPYNR
ncbi:hypothetical protein [Yeosuana marina]|uniref:hypothetical protein n=1 Tax=Yeosuana marina TaxID=1565536 RepID=UPI001422003F|nr:hypothetical protein [Yeosuana marina]